MVLLTEVCETDRSLTKSGTTNVESFIILLAARLRRAFLSTNTKLEVGTAIQSTQ